MFDLIFDLDLEMTWFGYRCLDIMRKNPVTPYVKIPR